MKTRPGSNHWLLPHSLRDLSTDKRTRKPKPQALPVVTDYYVLSLGWCLRLELHSVPHNLCIRACNVLVTGFGHVTASKASTLALVLSQYRAGFFLGRNFKVETNGSVSFNQQKLIGLDQQKAPKINYLTKS